MTIINTFAESDMVIAASKLPPSSLEEEVIRDPDERQEVLTD